MCARKLICWRNVKVGVAKIEIEDVDMIIDGLAQSTSHFVSQVRGKTPVQPRFCMTRGVPRYFRQTSRNTGSSKAALIGGHWSG